MANNLVVNEFLQIKSYWCLNTKKHNHQGNHEIHYQPHQLVFFCLIWIWKVLKHEILGIFLSVSFHFLVELYIWWFHNPTLGPGEVLTITKTFRYLKWRVSWTLQGGYVWVGFPLHNPYISLTNSLYRWGCLYFTVGTWIFWWQHTAFGGSRTVKKPVLMKLGTRAQAKYVRSGSVYHLGYPSSYQ